MFFKYLTMKHSILALLAGVVFATSVYADIVVEKKDSTFGERVYHIHIINTITKSDYASLQEKVTAADASFFFFRLNSRGGDVITALKIGRFLRKIKHSSVSVPENSICYSACVFILSGAHSRFMRDGKIGIHRPYDPNDRITSPDAQKAKYAKMGKMIKNYLSEMNVKPQLYDDMLYISPDNVRILSNRELLSYGLVEEDPFQDEADAVRWAKNYGISREEYGKRKIRADRDCLSNPSLDTNAKGLCWHDIMSEEKEITGGEVKKWLSNPDRDITLTHDKNGEITGLIHRDKYGNLVSKIRVLKDGGYSEYRPGEGWTHHSP